MVERLNGLDMGMLAGETPEWHMHTGALVLLEPIDGHDIDVASGIRAVLNARRALLGPFRYRLLEAPLGLGRSVWVDSADLDLGAQVRRVGVPAPGGMREVASLAGHLFSSPLSRGGPLWEIWVLEGLEGGHVGLLVKVHHALMDGIRGARLFEALFDLEPDAPLARSDGERVATDRAPSRLRMLAGSGVFLAGTPLRALHLGAEMVSAGGRLARVLASREGRAAALPFRAPRTLLNRPLTSRRAFAFASVSLEDMRTVKRAFGVTMNDVALALSAHVLRRYLVERDDLPESALLAQIPVGVHRDGDASGGNFVAATGASLHTDIAEPVERLAAIHESMQSAKAMQAALGDDIVIDALAVFPPAVISAGLGLYRGLDLAAIHPPIFNAIISNVPGPQIPLYSCGARLAATYTLGPLLLGCGINITLMSYQGRVDFGVAVCPDVVEEPWELADGIPDSLAVLRKAAGA
ncbi:MAG: WS/DGAT/MGAT family O-acyltransferase [Acidimicrobiia bacterium]